MYMKHDNVSFLMCSCGTRIKMQFIMQFSLHPKFKKTISNEI